MPSVTLPWKEIDIELDLPENWELMGVLEHIALAGVRNPKREVERSLRSPIGSPRLSELAKPGMKIALVIDDGSRPTPITQIFPAVVAELRRGGVKLDQVTVVAALGVHRAMDEGELAERIGGKYLASMKVVNHDCDDPQKLVYLGKTSRGTPVHINKTVAESDLVISIGCIEPHVIASFGGGYKNILPGVAGRVSIAHNHTLNCKPQTYNMVGQPIENNPMRLDLEEACCLLKQPVFIINAVINSNLDVVKVVCGDGVAAHRAGVEVSASIYGVRVPDLADVVITSSHPMDTDLRQGVKALSNNVRAMRPGGVMINLIRADEGVGVFGLANRKLPLGKAALRLLAPLLLPLVPRLNLKGMGEEDRFFLYFALQLMRLGTVYIYAPTIPVEIHERLPFVTFVSTPQEALTLAQLRLHKPLPLISVVSSEEEVAGLTEERSPRVKVLVIPHGGMTYPILSV